METDIEKLSIRYLLHNPNAAQEFIKTGIDESFYFTPLSRSLAQIVFEYYKRYGQAVTRAAFMAGVGTLDMDTKEVEDFLDLTHTEDLIDTDVAWVTDQLITHKKQYIMKRGIQKVVESMDDPSDAEDKLMKVTQAVVKLRAQKDLTVDLNSEINSIVEHLKIPKQDKRVLTGFKEFDEACYGLKPGWLVLFVSRPKVGKTRTLINLAVNMMVRKINVLVFSLEVPQEQYINLVLSCAAGLPYAHIEDHKMSQEEYNILETTKQQMSSYGKLTIVDTLGPVSPQYIESKINELEISQHIKYDVVIVDHGSMMKATTKMDRDDLTQGSIAEDLRAIAREKGCVMLTAVQRKQEAVKKRNPKEDITGSGEDIARSDIWFQTSDVVVIIHKPDDVAEQLTKLQYKIISRYSDTVTFEMFKDFEITRLYSSADSLVFTGKEGSE